MSSREGWTRRELKPADRAALEDLISGIDPESYPGSLAEVAIRILEEILGVDFTDWNVTFSTDGSVRLEASGGIPRGPR